MSGQFIISYLLLVLTHARLPEMDKRDINPEEQTLMLFALLAFNRIHRSAFVDLRGWKPDCMQAFSLVHYNQPSATTAAILLLLLLLLLLLASFTGIYQMQIVDLCLSCISSVLCLKCFARNFPDSHVTGVLPR